MTTSEKTYGIDYAFCDYIEREPGVFYQCGSFIVSDISGWWTGQSVDNKRYKVDFDELIYEKGSFNIVIVGIQKQKKIFDIFPYGTIEINFLYDAKTPWGGSKITFLDGYTKTYSNSENMFPLIIMNALDYYEIPWLKQRQVSEMYGDRYMGIMRFLDDHHLLHCVHGWGYGNAIWIRFSIRDLLNFNPKKYSKKMGDELHHRVKMDSFLKDVIPDKLYTKGLTDNEKIKLATKVLEAYHKKIKK